MKEQDSENFQQRKKSLLKWWGLEREQLNGKLFQSQSCTNQPGCCRERQQRICTIVVQFYLLIVIQARPLEQITQASHSSLLDGTQGLSSVFIPGPACFVAPFLICSFGAAHWVEWMGRMGRRDFRNTNSRSPLSLYNNLLPLFLIWPDFKNL